MDTWAAELAEVHDVCVDVRRLACKVRVFINDDARHELRGRDRKIQERSAAAGEQRHNHGHTVNETTSIRHDRSPDRQAGSAYAEADDHASGEADEVVGAGGGDRTHTGL